MCVSWLLLLLGLEIVSRSPSPGIRPAAALDHALDVDVGNDIAVSAQEGLRRAHLGTQRQLAFGDPVTSVELIFFNRPVRQRAAGAEGTLVHLAPGSEGI